MLKFNTMGGGKQRKPPKQQNDQPDQDTQAPSR